MADGLNDGVTELLNAAQMDTALRRMASEILDRHPSRKLAFVGIRRRGVPLAARLEFLEIGRPSRPVLSWGISDARVCQAPEIRAEA